MQARLSCRSGMTGLGRRDWVDELFGQTLRAGAASPDGHDDRLVAPAKPHHPRGARWAASRAGGGVVDLDGDGRVLQGLSLPVRTDRAGRRAEPGRPAGALAAHRLAAAGPAQTAVIVQRGEAGGDGVVDELRWLFTSASLPRRGAAPGRPARPVAGPQPASGACGSSRPR